MRLATPRAMQLTYCTNVHLGAQLADVHANLSTHIASVKAQVAPRTPFGLGLWLTAENAATLVNEPAALAQLDAALAERDAYVFTLNGFPFGAFHGEAIKTRVYTPDWRSDERLNYTNHLAQLLAHWLPSDISYGSISTLPVGYQPAIATPADIELATSQLLRHVAVLVELERTTGKQIKLALEPEPMCFLETIDETCAFFREHLYSRSAEATLGRATGTGPEQAEQALHRHLGVCLDACHAAVEHEDPGTVVSRIDALGIPIAKLQLSTGMQVNETNTATIAALQAFSDDVYLHQVVELKANGLQRYLDLPDALQAYARHPSRASWRIHYHLPIFLEHVAGFTTTQPFLIALLEQQAQRAFTSHLEVETYTWDVLPAALRCESVDQSIARELTWVLDQLKATPT